MHLSPASLLAFAAHLLVFTALFVPATSLPDRTTEEVNPKVFGMADLDIFDGEEGIVDQDEEAGGRSLEEADDRMYASMKEGLMKQRRKYQLSRYLGRHNDDAVVVGGDDVDNRNGFLDWLYGIIGITTTTAKPELHPPEHCEVCSCGQTIKKNRIVGGQETEVLEYPWMALLLYNGAFYCGGTLINDNYILTAAHCVSGFKREKMAVRLLEHNRETSGETTTITRKIKRIVPHPRYSNSNYNNDIALLHMDEPVELKGELRPVCMPERGKSFTGYGGIVTGWGALEEGGAVSPTLQVVTVPIMSNVECRKTAYGETRITDNMLCAGYPEGGKDSCQGDSGGGLLVNNATTNLHHVAGIVSWGEGCAKPDHPGVYTRVNRYLTWIKNNTPDACYC